MENKIKRIHAVDLMDASRVGKLLYLSAAPRRAYDEKEKRYTDEVIALNIQCMPVEFGAVPITVRVPCEAENDLPAPGSEIRFEGLKAVPYIASGRSGRQYIALSFKADGIVKD